jgi:hypothetical protein
MFGVVLLPMFHLRVVAHGLAILNAVTDVDVGVDAFTNVIRQGLIHLLVGVAVATLAARWTRGRPS